MTDYSKITALYSRLSVGDEDRDGGESNSIQNPVSYTHLSSSRIDRPDRRRSHIG